jgi:hypothetical protein
MRQTACLGRALALAVVALGCSAVAARAAAYTESINGDLSGVAAAPTPWVLELGANPLTGTAGANFNTGANDYDLVAFTIPAGRRLDSILVTNYQNVDPFALAFFGLQAGTPWLDGFGFEIGGNFLMGWAHIDSTMEDVDLLYKIQDHANDPPFAIPLASGTYTMLIQDIDTSFDYTLTFNVSQVPEPASAALLAIGGAWLLRRGGKRRESRSNACGCHASTTT